MFFVYAVYNKNLDRIYIGQTNDLKRRLDEHNSKRGNHFTARIDGNWEIIYKEEVATRERALTREKQLKSYKGREFIKKHIPQ